MPSSIVVNGQRRYVPGIYAKIDASALGGRNASVGNLALVADLRNFPQAAPLRFNNARALQAFDAADDELALLGKLAFSPSDDPATRGGAAALFVVSPATTTQATSDLLDSGATTSIQFTSTIYGLRANRTRIAASKSGTEYTFDITREGLSEQVKVSPAKIADFLYTAGALGDAELTWGALTADYFWQRQPPAQTAGAPQTISTDWDQSPIDTVVTAFITGAGLGAAHSAAVTMTVVGLDLTGAAASEVISFGVGVTGPLSTTGSYSSITSVTIATTDAAWVGETNITGSVSYETAARTVDEVLIDLDAIPSFAATSADPRTAQIVSSEVEPLSSQDVTAAATLRADGYFIVDAFGSSDLVTAEQVSFKAPSLASDVLLSFVGGSESSPSTSDWQDALDSLLDQDVQIVALLDSTATVQALLPTHCNNAALQGYERNAWAGAEGGKTIQEVYDGWVRLRNSSYVSIVADKITVDHPNGSTPELEPPYLALMLAAMQAGSPIAWPLTRNRPRILSADQEWGSNLDAGEAISKGICILSYDRLGWYVARSVNTYLTDDNPILSEVSSFESVQTSVRDLRDFLNFKIGEPGVISTATNLKALAEDRLRVQVNLGYIKAFQSVFVEDLGDTFDINYEVAAVEPINFIRLNASIVRISG